MATVYAKIEKITNAVGRHQYLVGDHQEEVVLAKQNMTYDWATHSTFEKQNRKTNQENNEALEVIVKLPNDLSKDITKLEFVLDDMAEKMIGKNHDYEYAVHWNSARTNLHAHIMFSERENALEPTPKTYKKDIWQDKDTHKLAKAGTENAVLVHRKGDVQYDQDGNIKYNDDIFQAKDPKYKTREWLHNKNRAVQEVLKEHGYELDRHDGIDKDKNPYLAQKKLYKGASDEYLEKATAWNTQVREYNRYIKQHIKLEPEQMANYVDIKSEILTQVREASSREKKITDRAINMVHDMQVWVRGNVANIRANAVDKIEDTPQMFDDIKEQFADLFKERQAIQGKRQKTGDNIRQLSKVRTSIATANDHTKDTLRELEQLYRQQEDEVQDAIEEYLREAEKSGMER